jgi:hypothetical protein
MVAVSGMTGDLTAQERDGLMLGLEAAAMAVKAAAETVVVDRRQGELFGKEGGRE